MGRFIDDRYEAEFVLEQPVEQVWGSLAKQKKSDASWGLPGWGTTGSVIEVEAGVRLRVTKDTEPCKDTEIAVSLESVANGTKVLVVQSGFPVWVKSSLESFTIGGDQIIADLLLYLDRGVVLSRHSMPWAFAGFSAREVGAGLEITAAFPGSYAENVGLAPGDLLLTLGGAPVFTHLGLQAVLRVLQQGQETEATWVRGREMQRATASL